MTSTWLASRWIVRATGRVAVWWRVWLRRMHYAASGMRNADSGARGLSGGCGAQNADEARQVERRRELAVCVWSVVCVVWCVVCVVCVVWFVKISMGVSGAPVPR